MARTGVDVTIKAPELPACQEAGETRELTTDEYIQAHEIMIKSPTDRVGVLGSLGATGLGALAGGGMAAVLGVTTATTTVAATVLGSSTLGSLLGASALVPVVAATPVGWPFHVTLRSFAE